MKTHGMRYTREYGSWIAMRRRCLQPTDKDYPRYGGVGVKICKQFNSFECFLAEVGPRPIGTTLDRIDPRRGYEIGNVRWATPLQQSRNRRDLTVVKTPIGVMALVDYAKRIGLTKGAAHLRLQRGTLDGVTHARR